jgi:peptidoglycan/LPS O-acetylase OafA/YrhL
VTTLALAAALTFFHFKGGFPTVSPFKILWPTLEGALWGLFILFYLNVFRSAMPLPMKALGWLGELSYSLYLTHSIVFAIVLRTQIFILPANSSIILNSLLTTFLIALPASTLLALLTFNVIEKPFLDLRRVYLVRHPSKPAGVSG